MKYLMRAMLRGGIPFVIMAIGTAVMMEKEYDPFIVRSTFLTAIIVGVVSAASVIYELEFLSLFRQTAIHFLLMCLTVLPCLLVSGWFPLRTPGDYAAVLGIFLVVGIIFWCIGFGINHLIQRHKTH